MRLLRKVALVCLLVMMIGGAPPVGASAASKAAPSVQLSQRPMQLNADGSVTVTGWLRCSPPLYSFEYSVGVIQQTGSANAFLSQAEVLPCEGKRTRFAIVVPAPGEGLFTAGRAQVGIYVGLYDPVADRDLSLEDSVNTRLRACVRGR